MRLTFDKAIEQIDHTTNEPTLVKSSTVNLMQRAAWVPPPQVPMREGSFDYLQWPSKGGD